MFADGGNCLADPGAVRDQQVLFGQVASNATAFRVIDQIAGDPAGLEWLRAAHAHARARVWKLAGAPGRLTIDLDATLIASHSYKEGAAGNFEGGFGFHPMLAYADETSEALAGELRAGNAGANTAADQIAVAEQVLQQIPGEHVESIELLLHVDSARASHELLEWCREARIRYSVGYDRRTRSNLRAPQSPPRASLSRPRAPHDDHPLPARTAPREACPQTVAERLGASVHRRDDQHDRRRAPSHQRQRQRRAKTGPSRNFVSDPG